MQNEKREIHTVFRRFPFFCLTKNLSLPALASLFRVSLELPKDKAKSLAEYCYRQGFSFHNSWKKILMVTYAYLFYVNRVKKGHNIARKHKKRGITVVLWFLFPYNVGCRRCCAEVPFKSGHANRQSNSIYHSVKKIWEMRTMMETEKDKTYKTSWINNRRYLGNKYKLLPFITRVVN